MRALSAVVVVVSHAIQIIWLPAIGLGNWTHRINSFLSETAVIIFFVLSGYLISASINANIVRNRRFDLLDYAFSRAVRIYPPLLFAAALSAALFAIMAIGGWPGATSRLAFEGDLYTARDTVSVTLDDLINTVTMRNGLLLINGALWSLYVEVKLYAIAGLVVFLAIGMPHLLLRIVAVLGVVWLSWIWSLGIPSDQWVYIAWWAAGAALFLAGRFRREKSTSGLAGMFAMAALIITLSPTAPLLEAGRVAVVLMVSYAMFFHWSWRAPLSKSVAGYSYTLYLVHFPILIFAYAWFLKFAGPQAPFPAWRLAVMGLGFAASFACAWAAAAFLEQTASIKSGIRTGIARARQSF